MVSVTKELKKITIYFIEEQEICRIAFESFFASLPHFELLGVSPLEEIRNDAHIISSFNPDVLVVGVKQLSSNTIDRVAEVRQVSPKTGIILLVLTCHQKDMELVNKCALSGGGGFAFISKASIDHIDQLAHTIVSVSEGQIVIDPRAGLFLMNSNGGYWKDLTAREMDVLRLLAAGYSNSAIAGTLFIDGKTVKNHINNLYQKLRTEVCFDGRHPRVSIARLYIEEHGKIEEPSIS